MMRDGVLELGDAGADHEAVERGTGERGPSARGAGRRRWSFHRYGSRNRVLNWAVRPSSSSSVSSATLSAKISSVTWPPPASSAQWPAFAAAATISGSTVVGVMPASRIGDLPVRRVKAVSTRDAAVGSVTGFGANADQRRQPRAWRRG